MKKLTHYEALKILEERVTAKTRININTILDMILHNNYNIRQLATIKRKIMKEIFSDEQYIDSLDVHRRIHLTDHLMRVANLLVNGVLFDKELAQ